MGVAEMDLSKVVMEMKKAAFCGNLRVMRPLTFLVLQCISSVYPDFWFPLAFKATHFV